MPSTLPSSFASAAAGRDEASSSRTARPDGSSYGDWPRRPNGATQTFRRSSTATSLSQVQQQRDQTSSAMPAVAASPATYVPPQVSASRNGPAPDTRYSKTQLLDLFKEQKSSGDLETGLADLYVGELSAAPPNGATGGRWARRDDNKHDMQPLAEFCWDRGGGIEPLGLEEMSDGEREFFMSSVNSTVKPTVPSGREGGQRELGNTRKLSMSQNYNTNAMASPTVHRNPNRRREPSESYPFPREMNIATTGLGRVTRDEPASAAPAIGLLRRRTELLDSEPDIAVDDQEGDSGFSGALGGTTPYGTVKRRVAGPMSAGLAGPSSPWSAAPASSNFASMGAFGSFAHGGTPTSATGRSESRFRGLMGKPSIEGQALSSRDQSAKQGRFVATDFGKICDRVINDSTAYIARSEHHGDDATQSFARGPEANDNEDSDPDLNYVDENAEEILQGRGLSDTQHRTIRAPAPHSPALTNPYQSPHTQMSHVQDSDLNDTQTKPFHLPGLGGFDAPTGQNQQPTDPRSSDRAVSYDSRYFERSQPANIQTRGFSGFGGLGALGGLGSPGPWSSNAAFGTGTPTRERNGFSDMFAEPRASTPGEVQTPSQTGPVGGNAFGAIGGVGQGVAGTANRGSRLGSLFATAPQQDQLRGIDHSHVARGATLLPEEKDFFEGHPGPSGLPMFGNQTQFRDVDSPAARSGRPQLDDIFSGGETAQAFRSADQFNASEHGGTGYHFGPISLQAPGQYPQQASFAPQPQAGQRIPSLSSTASGQLPASQQKTMVMPDRIRWIYRDPQGNTQGPWSGLEMHDWYRAGFFSPELLVKKVEDADYEPLAQLIRRIGNSREPFLVPQIGIPGPPTSQSASWPQQTIAPAVGTAVVPPAQPPFAGSFPSFGTTLTADQQNALEQRKQEEQYLMARQKEHLAQQQMLLKMQIQGPHGMRQQSLQHQQSAQSLNSQPSFGNLASAGDFQSSPLQAMSQIGQPGLTSSDQVYQSGPVGSGFDPSMTEETYMMMERMSFESGNEQGLTGRPGFEDEDGSRQRIDTMLDDRARLVSEQEEDDRLGGLSREEEFLGNPRLQEFRNLRAQLEAETPTQQEMAGANIEPSEPGVAQDGRSLSKRQRQENSQGLHDERQGHAKSLSLAEQVQKAASAKQSPAIPQAGFESEFLDTTPPPQSVSPLPAPAARRNRSHVADALAAESLSQRQSPALETPSTASLAPWAREAPEPQKLPSLKEIQEAEAKQAAKQEELAAALRRAQLEKDLAAGSTQLPPAPGLPSTSTWASTEAATSSAAPVGSAWSKPGAGKAAVGGSSSSKKTMQQIVQEEEALARKKKAAAAAAAAAAATVSAGAAAAVAAAAMGKRYADLASKVASTGPAASASSAWTTVGSSGKPKLTSTPSTAAVPTKSTLSTATTATTSTPKPTAASSTSKTSLAAAQLHANEEFKKWAIAELRPDLHKDIQVDDFVQNLLNFPSDTDLITEAVHMSSRTVDSRRFAEEFVRRRALADKGKVAEPSAHYSAGVGMGSAAGGTGNDGKGGSGGWSEVARKGGSGAAAAGVTSGGASKAAEESAFKIVPAKKKGGRK